MKRWKYSKAICRSLCLSLVLAVGCVTVPQQPAQKPRVTTSNGPPAFTGNAIAAIDPCADQIQDLCGALLSYYLVKHKLPLHLEELQQYADVGQVLKFTCPVSGQPYVYVREGIEAPGQNLRIYIYDAAPAHGGARWCAVSKSGATVGADAIFAEKIPEKRFSQFLAATPAPSAPASPRSP
jgi:hypothetical protein